MSNIDSSYLSRALDVKQQKKMLRHISKFLRTRINEFDAIAIRGMSGALVGSIIAARLNKPLIVVRKQDGNHSGRRVEGIKNAKDYIILDDLISTGDTADIIKDEVKNFNGAKLVGIVLYNGWSGEGFLQNCADRFDCWIHQLYNEETYPGGFSKNEEVLVKPKGR